jgi:hypothetical protein
MARVTFAASAEEFSASVESAETIVVVAPAAALKDGSAWAVLTAVPALAPVLASPATAAMAEDISPSVEGSSTATYIDRAGSVGRLVFVALPDSASRLYSDTHSMAISGGLVDAGLGDVNTAVLAVLAADIAVEPAARAIARACPTFHRKSSPAASSSVVVGFVVSADTTKLLDGPSVSVVAPIALNAVRLTARLAETPAEQMNTDGVEVSDHGCAVRL